MYTHAHLYLCACVYSVFNWNRRGGARRATARFPSSRWSSPAEPGAYIINPLHLEADAGERARLSKTTNRLQWGDGCGAPPPPPPPSPPLPAFLPQQLYSRTCNFRGNLESGDTSMVCRVKKNSISSYYNLLFVRLNILFSQGFFVKQLQSGNEHKTIEIQVKYIHIKANEVCCCHSQLSKDKM